MPEWMMHLLASGAYFEKPNDGGAGGDGTGEVDGKNGEEVDEGGKKKPTDAEAKLIKDLMKAKADRDAAKDAKKAADEQAGKAKSDLETLQAQLTELLGEEGLDGLKAKLSQAEKDEQERQAKAGEWEALKARMVKEHEKALNKLKADLEAKIGEAEAKAVKADAHIRRLLVSNAFAGSKYRADELTLTAGQAEKLVGSAFKVEERDGELKVVAYKGNEPIVDSDGKPFDFDAALKEVIEADPDHKTLLKNKSLPGSGSRGSKSGVIDPADTNKPELKGEDRIKAGLVAQQKK